MIVTRMFATAVVMISLTGVAWAANPTQVGTWVGSAKIVTFTAGTNKTVSKQEIQIDIAADDLTTITVGGVVQSSMAAAFNDTDNFVVYGSGDAVSIATFNFKNTTMKGTSVGFTASGGLLASTSETKYKLKKQ